MKTDAMHLSRPSFRPIARPCHVVLGLLAAVVLLSAARVSAQAPAAPATTADSARKLPPDQLQSLVAPIALYPDDLLAQTLVASTYPLELIQLQQWLVKHPGLKDKALADSVAKQPWDPSIQSMAAVPDVVKRLADDVQWTTDLGNAFLIQQADVMTAVQVMRTKAKDKGALASNEQQKVKVDTVEQKQVIVVESANPEVIYVPVYSPAVVYPPPVYPYPPIYYPPYPPGAAMVTFTVGLMWGAAVWGGACCHAGWGGNDIYINNNNNFNQINHNGGGANGNWQHNAEHRGGAPYGDKATANKYGGSARGQSPSTGKAGGAQGQRGAGAGTQPAGGAGGGQRGAGAGTQPAGGAGGGGQRGASAGTQPSGGAGAGQAGSRDASRGASPSTGFSGGSGGYSGANARASSSRGASSMGSRGGGGMSRGGGGGRR
jgi:hypothetical protein